MALPISSDVSTEGSDAELEDLTRLFRALSDPVRVRILLLLTVGERNVTSLCTATGLAQPTVSHHLGLLRMSALVEGRRAGKSIYYSPGPRIRVDDAGSIVLHPNDAPTPKVRIHIPPSDRRLISPADRGGERRLPFAEASGLHDG